MKQALRSFFVAKNEYSNSPFKHFIILTVLFAIVGGFVYSMVNHERIDADYRARSNEAIQKFCRDGDRLNLSKKSCYNWVNGINQ